MTITRMVIALDPAPHKPPFDYVDKCSSEGREKHTVVADLEGTLLRSRSSFPYFLLVALEGGSLLRAIVLTLLSPLVWILENFVSETAAIQVLIFFSFAGLKVSDIQAATRAVLPKFYAEDVHPQSWKMFSSCRRKCIATISPRIMVEPFATIHLGADKVLGTEIDVTKRGRATGLVKPPGFLVGAGRRNAVEAEFDNLLPDLGLGDSVADYPFMYLCKEAYLVPDSRVTPPVPMENLFKPVIFHDGRLVQRPTPLMAFLTILWLPIGFCLAVIRVLASTMPLKYAPILAKLVGVRLVVKGAPPPSIQENGQGYLFVCSHRTVLDPVFLSIALTRQVTAVTYSISRITEVVSPIKTVRLSRIREKDAADIKRLLETGDLVICPEGTTCREPFLLRFSALFAELTERIVPVATRCNFTLLHGTTVRGWKSMDVFFCMMNPIPEYEIIFLDPLPFDRSFAAGRPAYEVADYIQKEIAKALGFECTTFTRKDKYRMLAGSDGSASDKITEDKAKE